MPITGTHFRQFTKSLHTPCSRRGSVRRLGSLRFPHPATQKGESKASIAARVAMGTRNVRGTDRLAEQNGDWHREWVEAPALRLISDSSWPFDFLPITQSAAVTLSRFLTVKLTVSPFHGHIFWNWGRQSNSGLISVFLYSP
jgi:hypothetical protein